MTCNHCGSTDVSTKVWFCWSCCKQIQTPEPAEQITEEDQEIIELLEKQPKTKGKKK